MNPIPRAVLGRRGARRARSAVAFLASAAVVLTGVGVSAAAPAKAVVGQGFTVSPADLEFILKQIKISEYHANNTTTTTGPCGALLGSGPNQIASPLLSFGLRTVDGSCNNLQSGQETFGAADQTFPRLTEPVFSPAEDSNVPGIGPVGPPGATSYAQTSGSVVDSEPRTVSNLIVDQTSTNPAAVEAAGFPVRTQGNEGVVPCTVDPSPGDPNGTPDGCVPENQTLFIPNVTTDVGLSPPFNGLFTIFGQFFDHGLDKITNGGGAGTVFVPLKADDPLVTRGPDGIAGNGDEVDESLRFMTLSRGKIVPGADGFRNAANTDTPFVDQSQTYTSHASHQFFLREYDSTSGTPKATGRFLDKTGDDHGLATWADIKTQAATQLGIELRDVDVNDIPMVVTDQYGNYIPGPARGMPQYVLADGVTFVEGDTASPVSTSGLKKIGTAFLNDISHSAAPTQGSTALTPDSDTNTGTSLDPVAPGEYDNELLDQHAICGDGRCNENIALQAVHQVFHNEHNRLVGDIEATLAANPSLRDAYQAVNLTPGSDRTFTYEERLFQAARFVTEMQYQHLVFEEFARKVQPAINPFEAFAFNQTDVDPAITAEFAHAVYRFGHSMLTEDIARKNPDGSNNDIPLLDGFLNPAEYYRGAGGAPVNAKQAATSIIMGMSDQTGNEIDEFVTNTLRNNLLGLPLDLPAINMTRARSEGIPPLNEVRRQIFAASNDGQLTPYTNWVDFGQALKHPSSLVNFVAAYGTHPIVTGATTLAGKRTAAERIVNGLVLPGPDGILADDPLTLDVDESADNVNPPADSGEFMFGTDSWADAGGKTSTGVDDIDLWVGGLAETTNPFGGLLGTTFNYVFENQLTNLQNGDRFYYLARTPGMNLRAQLEGNSFAELMMRNTDASTLKADPFATADCKFELGNLTGAGVSGNFITGPGSVNDDPASECNENRLLLRQPNGTIEYRARNSVDPSGINGQAVYNGRPGTFVDRIVGGNDNDTFWGGAGNDVIDGGSGDDVVLGGEGDDIITDLAGADVPKGGPGNDAIDGGIGDDIVMGGDGKDFTNGGANLNEHFLGAGDDFAIAGQGADAVFGDSGDDWEEGGDQPDLLIGD
ncbi:peroxidase family protein, partial [Kineosporia sp. R_H_3]|uniref:peroxidase family protein n=1 Tax=Kineosporia sp. R_H_3 TaxID=1961848 RepID=UPI0026F4484A